MIAGTVGEDGIAVIVGRVAGNSGSVTTDMLEETMAAATPEVMTADSVADRASAEVSLVAEVSSTVAAAATAADAGKRQFC